MVRNDVVLQDLGEGFIRNAALRAIIGVAGGVADQVIDLAPFGDGGINQRLQAFLTGNIGRHADGGFAADGGVDLVPCGFAGIRLAAGDHHVGAMFGHAVGNGLADAAAGTGDEGGLPGQIKKRRKGHGEVSPVVV